MHFEWPEAHHDAQQFCQFYWGGGGVGMALTSAGSGVEGGGWGITRMVQYAGVAARLKVAPIRLLYHAIPFD